MNFSLHSQLQNDCHLLGYINKHYLLLHKNADIPWFILVPMTDKNEIYKLPAPQQLSLQTDINRLASFIEQHFNADKLNIATIGNIVPQLHIHIIARFFDDVCWPNPVWGQTSKKSYNPDEIAAISKTLIKQNLLSKTLV